MSEKLPQDRIERALEVANATEWEGDSRACMLIMMKALRTLSLYVNELRMEVEKRDIWIDEISERYP